MGGDKDHAEGPSTLTLLKATSHLFRWSAALGLASGCIAACMQAYNNYGDPGFFKANVHTGGGAYTGFATLCVFFVVFRLGQAYGSYWAGIELCHKMLADWSDASSSIMALCNYSTEPINNISTFQHLLIRLVSFLNALIFAALEDKKDVNDTKASRFDVIDLDGLDDHTVQYILNSGNSAEVVFQKIQNLLIANMKSGVLSIPPVILNRCFEELSNAIRKFHEAEKLLVPFPRPYILVQNFLLLAFAGLTPIWMTIWTQTILGSLVFTFLLVFSLHGLTAISGELDNPFDHQSLDFETHTIQNRLNAMLKSNMREAHTPLPNLSASVHFGNAMPIKRSSTILSMIQGGRGNSKESSSIQHKADMESGLNTPICWDALPPSYAAPHLHPLSPQQQQSPESFITVERGSRDTRHLAFINSATVPSFLG